MRRYAPLSLALLGAALAAPGTARAWQDPAAGPTAGFSHSVPAPAPVPLDHKHFGKVKKGLAPCEKCEAAKKAGKVYQLTPPSAPMAVAANPMGMALGTQIVGCTHSQNGVCKECRRYLEMPGQITMVSPGAPGTVIASTPGHDVASDAAPGFAVAEADEPQPIGLMKTTYNSASQPAGAKTAQPPAPVGPGSTPFAPQVDEHDPHVISHLFGISAWQRDWRDMWESSRRRKREAHAAISYDAPAEKPTDLPASAVYGRNGSPR